MPWREYEQYRISVTNSNWCTNWCPHRIAIPLFRIVNIGFQNLLFQIDFENRTEKIFFHWTQQVKFIIKVHLNHNHIKTLKMFRYWRCFWPCLPARWQECYSDRRNTAGDKVCHSGGRICPPQSFFGRGRTPQSADKLYIHTRQGFRKSGLSNGATDGSHWNVSCIIG